MSNEKGRTEIRDGTAFYFDENNRLHREDGPAVETTTGVRVSLWYREGKLHREDGPAVENRNIRDGSGDEWYLDGKQYTAEEFFSITGTEPDQGEKTLDEHAEDLTEKIWGSLVEGMLAPHNKGKKRPQP